MQYQSTRGNGAQITAAQAIAQGLSENGGLYVPENFPQLSEKTISDLASMSYKDRAAYILDLYLSDFSIDEISRYTSEAYSMPNFSNPAIAPLHKLDKSTHFLELWHGPTCAFKDMALQMLPHLLTASLRKIGEKRQVCVLVATSGDTGKAALEGFCDISGTKVMVFYPDEGVSDVQKLQMTTQEGENVNVVAIEGNFDDAQAGVKAIFSDAHLQKELDKAGFLLSSANSINWGRLVPQIVYYISAYCDLINQAEITPGEKINFCVPTGNFGNILAAYYAMKMGLPIGKLVCASNSNDVLTEFLKSGIYDKNRQFFTTVSPSMDILVSSNLERLLFDIMGRDGQCISNLMAALNTDGRYVVQGHFKDEIDRIFSGGMCSEEDTLKTIATTYHEHKYLMDTHTAVAYKVLSDYRNKTGDETKSVIVSTASPFKFCDSVLSALGCDNTGDGMKLLKLLAQYTQTDTPTPLAALEGKKARFLTSISIDNMKTEVLKFLKG
ncbi:MAG: threonine synthase [Oscillospiraceae bacterium]|nr:threonine synthase [Oscillospiraceae bacterium]